MRSRTFEWKVLLPTVLAAVLGWGLPCAPAFGQRGGWMGVSSTYDLSGDIQVEEAGRTVRTYLDRVDTYLADGKWDEAVDSLRQVMETSGEKLIAVSPNRYVTTRTACQLRLVDVSGEALQLYRDLVDPVTAEWYRAWQKRRDQAALERIVDEAFASSWGDDALAALGEVAFERGDYATARAYWRRILPFNPPEGEPRGWLSFPGSDMNLAEIRARLVMLTIFEGREQEAQAELATLKRLHPGARGRLGGREVVLADALATLIQESRSWPDLPTPPDWPTFAGSDARHREAVEPRAVGEIAWCRKLASTGPTAPVSLFVEPTRPVVAEDKPAPLSYHPVLADGLLFLSNPSEILALDAATGEPAWGSGSAAVFRDELHETSAGAVVGGGLGTARHTLTVGSGRLYARMGSGVTTRPRQPSRGGTAAYLVCLDLKSQGRLLWKSIPEDGWAYEGAPLVRGDDVFVAMRQSDIRPRAYVACLNARTGLLRWRRFVCAAETPSRGIFAESTNGLLTLDGDTLYFSTNLGVVAALAAVDGRIRWLTTYPRALKGDLLKPAIHWARDLTPCLADRGTLYVAPADTPHVLALAADNGQILWQSSPRLSDVVHLLGVTDECLIAGGRKLYWIETGGSGGGRVKTHWPEGHERIGFGRGLITRKHVWWPTRTGLFVFDRESAQLVRRIDLAPRGATGGNLVVAAGRLVIAGGDRLTAFADESLPIDTESEPLARRDEDAVLAGR